MEFYEKLEAWYAQNARSLPWRETQDPYRVWVSEIILQQTRVEQGRGYYERFLKKFPDVRQLAAAPLDSVMRVWEGLGYYSRARNMHCAARQVVERGDFPKDYDGLRKLKGVGEYTAAAIASFCYGQAKAVVDGNVYRVLSRYYGMDTPIDTAAGKRDFAAMAQMVMDKRQPAFYNQAIMDFGALQCTPKSPDCMRCPLADSCRAYAEGTVERFPVKSRRLAVTTRHLIYIILENTEGCVLIHRRNSKDIWQGLYEPLLFEPGSCSQVQAIPLLLRWLEQKGLKISPGDLRVEGHVGGLRHQLTHRTIVADAYHVGIASHGWPDAMEDYIWVRPDELAFYGFPKLVNRIFSHFGIRK